MFRNSRLRLSRELPCCKACKKKDTCCTKQFVDAFKCQKNYEDLISIYRDRSPMGRVRLLHLLSNEDIVAQTEYIRDLRKKNRR